MKYILLLLTLTLTTFALCGEITAIQSFLELAREINRFAFACDSSSELQLGPIKRKSTDCSSLLLYNSYAVLRLTDLNSVFELFIFSDTLQLNREILKEGSSLILTLIKSISDGENRFRRINVQKIASLKDLLNKPIEEVTFNLKSLQELSEISKFLPKLGDTLIKIKLSDEKNNFDFQLKKKRNIDRKTINLIRNKEISAVIS